MTIYSRLILSELHMNLVRKGNKAKIKWNIYANEAKPNKWRDI